MSHCNPSLSSSPARGVCKATVLVAALGLAAGLAGCGGGDHDKPGSSAGSRVAYRPTETIKAAAVLTGDASSGRCADDTQPCYKDNDDILNGQSNVLRIEDVAWGARSLRQSNAQTYEIFGGAMVGTSNSAFDTTGDRATSLTGDFPYNGTSAPVVLGARLFRGDKDVAVTAIGEAKLTVVVDSREGLVTVGTGASRPANAKDSVLLGAKGALTRNGLDAVVFGTVNLPGTSSATLQVAAAANPDDPRAGLRFGPALGVFPMEAVAVGDFFGTGPMVVSAVERDATIVLYYYTVDSTTLALTWDESKTLTLNRPAGGAPVTDVSMAAGRFNTIAYDQLLIGLSDPLRVDLLSVDTGENGLPVQRLSGVSDHLTGFRPVLRAGRFDWSSPYDSVAYMLVNADRKLNPPVSGQARTVEILRFDDFLDVIVAAATPLGADQCIYDMQVGNFDRRDKDLTPHALPDATIPNPNLQLVFASSSSKAYAGDGTCSAGDQTNNEPGLTLSIWNVVIGSDGALQLAYDVASISYSDNPIWNDASLDQVSLAVVDLKGRSLRLGAPEIINVERRTQPSVVVAAPPMHADWIDGQLRNFSMAPGGFNVTYQTKDRSTVLTNTKHTTTWSWTAEEEFEGNFSQGPCGLVCAKQQFKASAKQALDGATESNTKAYRSFQSEIKVATGQFDQLWFQDSSLTLYIYPVLGRTVCRGGAATCDAGDQVPMTLTIAAPDTISNVATMDASALTWYQPTWMPGNLLSYPATLGQLTAAEGDLNVLTQPTKFNSGSEDVEQKLTWKVSNADGTATQLNQNYSFKASASVSTSWGTKAISSGSVKFGFSTGGSFGFKSLSDSTTTLSASTGLAFEKKAVFAPGSQYRYDFTPYVFSDVLPPDAQSVESVADSANAAFGVLRSGYVVDVLSQTAGTIWSDSKQLYSKAPDVAFNQPLRFLAEPPLDAPGHGDTRCLSSDGSVSQYDCVEMEEPKPEDPWTDDYHKMRGFFVTDPGAKGGGPQLSTIDAGKPVLLQARVHNFSMKDMPAGSQVRVSFYLMRWDTSINAPIGKSIYLGTGQTDPVQRYRNDVDTPNWRLVQQTFANTADYQDQDVVFWAVTWIEDANGNLVGELPGKGLKQIPPREDLEFAEAAALEEEYGNNVGFYNQVFHVFAPSTAVAAPSPAAATRPSVQMTHSGAHKTVVQPGERTVVGTRLAVGDSHLPGGLRVVFYDGDPRAGGRAIGTQTLPHLRRDTHHEFVASFRSNECGTHTIHAVAGPGTRFEHHVKVETIDVDCSRVAVGLSRKPVAGR